MDDFTIIEIKTVFKAPIILNFTDFIDCPVCENEIEVKNKIITDNSLVNCEVCTHTIKLKIVNI